MAMKSSISQKNAIKRIYLDLKENYQNPIEGIKVFIPNNDDLFHLHCEIEILYGPYKDIVIHSILHIPSSYPVIGPAMNIADDFHLPHNFHHHIIASSICNDMLTNYKGFFKAIDSGKELEKASGWSSGYTLNVILSQMQIFFADPDMKVSLSQTDIKKLIEYSKNYKCKDCSNRNEFKPEDSSQSNESINQERINKLKSNLVCGLSKCSYLSNKDILLGYPILMKTDRRNRLWPQILIELLSYDGYIMQIQELGIDKLNNFEKIKMFSPNGDSYNYWIPAYINEEHFQRGLTLILNSISVIRNGINGSKENDFKPEMILQVLPCLINKTIVFMLNGTLFHSLAAIQAYCHLLRLYYKLINNFPQLKSQLINDVKQFKDQPEKRNKQNCPDLGEFIVNIFLSGVQYSEISSVLLNEFMARQIFWIQKNKEKSIEELAQLPIDQFKSALFESSRVANHLLMFNIMSAKYFITEKSIQEMDQNLGFIPDKLLNDFKEVILKIKNVSTYEVFFNIIGIHGLNDVKFKNLIFDSKAYAFKSRYLY